MTVLVSQAAGCIITSESGEDAFITAQWSLKSLDSNAIIPYPPNVTTAAVKSQPVDANFRPVGNVITDLFDVENNAGTTAPLDPDVYQVWVELQSENGTVHAQSLSAYVDVIDDDKTFTTTILEDGGYFQLAWNLVGASTNAPLSCEQAGLAAGRPSGIYIEAFLASSTTAEATDIFDCADGAGITGGYPEGNYDVLVDARSTTDTPVGGAPTISKTIGDRNQVTNLGTVNIPITGL
jgi:hypothetical protein